MIDTLRRHPVMAIAIAFFLLLLILSTFVIVPETKQAIIIRFGKPERILNRFQPGNPIGGPGAGLAARIPFADNIVWVDKRVQAVDMERQQVLSTDQLRLQVDAFARFRIVDPLRMYIRARSEERVAQSLRPILGSELRNELGKVPFAVLLTPERGVIMEHVRAGLNRVASQYGAEVLDVRIKRADLPDGTPLESAFERMRTARLQEARSIRAQGAKQAQIVRAQADADAARTYSASFGKDPQFYDFYRSMQSYETTFVGDNDNKVAPTTMVLSPDNDYLKQFRNGGE